MINFEGDPNANTEYVITSMKNVLDRVFPLKKLSRKQAELERSPWMTREIITEMKKRDELKLKFIKSGSNNIEEDKTWKKFATK